MMKLYAVNTGYFKLDGGAMFGVVPKSIWSKINQPDENNLCNWAMRCLLIEDGNRLILIDNGIGDKQDSKFLGHYFLNGKDTLDTSLSGYGFQRDDITDVFLTHLHFDHCGGSIIRENDQLVPAFKNAVYWSNQEHWDWATHPNDREKASFLRENILPIQESGRLRMIEWIGQSSDHQLATTIFTDSIEVRLAHGHTRAMMLPQIKWNNRTLVFMADLLPSMGHIPLPYVMAYDMFPMTTLQEKKSFLQEAADKNYILFFEHDPHIECCEVHHTEKGIRPGKTYQLTELE